VIAEFDIAKLRLQAGDVLVVRMKPIPHDIAERVRESLTPVLPPGIKVLIIDHDTELSVLTQAEIDERSA
jgi:hypothetical protein